MPITRNSATPTSAFELREAMDAVLRERLGMMYAPVTKFYQVSFESVKKH